MVRHDDPRMLIITKTVEMLEGISYDLCRGRLAQKTFAVTGVQPALHGAGKAFPVFPFLYW